MEKKMKGGKKSANCFNAEIGDAFLNSWKPSKMKSVPNLDFDDGLPSVGDKSFNLPDKFDLDMDFDTGFSNKLSSFDIDFDFLKSPKHSNLAKEEHRGTQISQTQASEDTKIFDKSRDAGGTSTWKSQDQDQDQDQGTTSKFDDSDEALSWRSQTESTPNKAASNDKRVVKTPSEDATNETAHAISIRRTVEEAALEAQHAGTKIPSPQSSKDTRSLPAQHNGTSTFPAKEQQKLSTLPAQAALSNFELTPKKNANGQNALENVREPFGPESVKSTVYESTAQAALKKQSHDSQSGRPITEVEKSREPPDVQPWNRTAEEHSHVLQSEGAITKIQNVTEHSDLRHCKEMPAAEVTEHSHDLLSTIQESEVKIDPEQSALRPSEPTSMRIIAQSTKSCAIQVGDVRKEEIPTPLQNACLPEQTVLPGNSIKGRLRISSQEETRNSKRIHISPVPLREIIQGKISKPNSTERRRRSNSALRSLSFEKFPLPTLATKAKDMNPLNTTSVVAASTTIALNHKPNLLTAFRSLKPTQMTSLRMLKSQPLPPLRMGKKHEDPRSTSDGEIVQKKLKADNDVALMDALRTSRSPPVENASKETRGPTSKELSPGEQASADVLPNLVSENAPGKRPRFQTTPTIEKESHNLRPPDSRVVKPTLEEPSSSRHIPQSANDKQSYVPPSLGELSITRYECQEICRAAPHYVKETASAKTELSKHNHKRNKILGSHIPLEDSRQNSEAVMVTGLDLKKRAECHLSNETIVPHNLLKDRREGCTDAVMQEDRFSDKGNDDVCSQLVLKNNKSRTGQTEIIRGSEVAKTTAFYSVELDKIMNRLNEKQRIANGLLAETMAHNSKMKYLLDLKNQEKIMILQNSITEKLQDVKLQAARNRAKKCEWCEEERQGAAATLIKERCGVILSRK